MPLTRYKARKRPRPKETSAKAPRKYSESMFSVRCVMPECRNMLVTRRQASPCATNSGTRAPRIRTPGGWLTSPSPNDRPAEAATPATPRYARTQAAMRPKVTGRRETFKRGWLDQALAALPYLADGVAD